MSRKPKGFAKPTVPAKREAREEELIDSSSEKVPFWLNLLVSVVLIGYNLFQLAQISLERIFDRKGDRR
jgi:hypothetical protein